MQIERLPRFSENVDSATIVRPLVKPGDHISIGAVLFEMLTEKAEFEYTSNVSGKVLAVLAGEKDEVPVGYALLVTGLDDELHLVESVRQDNIRLLNDFRPGGMSTTHPQQMPSANVTPLTPDAAKIRATPSARRLARENAVDLATVKSKLAVDGILHEEHVRTYLNQEGKR